MASHQNINDAADTIYQQGLSGKNAPQVHSKYVTQLKGAMGATPSWFGQSAPNLDNFPIDGLGQAIFPASSSSLASIKDSSTLLTLQESNALRQASDIGQSPNRSLPLEPSNSGMTSWFGDNNSRLDFEFMKEDVRSSSSNDKMEDLLDVSDDTSQSNRMGSFHSRVLEASSHTSTGTDSIKLEAKDVLDDVQDESSRTSSLSSQLSPAKSTTPVPLQLPTTEVKPLKRHRTSTKIPRIHFRDLRPRTSIPSDVPHEELARQSVQAAYSSRLNPFALHIEEYQLLREHICHLHVTTYINVRNRILRLWVRNPLVSVTPEEAAGCAYSVRWLGLAEVAYEWLVRKGYINFGCLEVPDVSNVRVKKYKLKRTRKTIVVIGAGMAGLGCARQLEGLLTHYREKWTAIGEEPPKVIVLEGRSRIGGRIYSHPLQNGNFSGLPQQSRCTAEMGAHIITGFDHGNPLNMIIRGQLALHYYPLKDNSTLFDVDGQVVDRKRDKLIEKLFNDILERASIYRHRTTTPLTVEGDRALIEIGRDPTDDTAKVISAAEEEQQNVVQEPVRGHKESVQQVPTGVDKLTGKMHMALGSRTKARPALAAKAMGWNLASHVLATHDFNLEHAAKSSQYPTLGAVMDEAVQQYQQLLNLSPQDMRLLNWHFANLEYANAVNVDKLSLGGWDQDIGNEFEGEHAQVIGGYQQVPRGIWQYPSKLDLQTNKAVSRVVYNEGANPDPTAKIICDDGDVFDASHVVLTTPLGVLKSESITFEPLLPVWKRQAIERLGFGTLNKVILVFEKPFWNVHQDMIGLLRDATTSNSLNQGDYVQNRGRFYLFWNCIKTSGRPMLIALMAGDAAHQAELLSDAQIVGEVTQQLALMFKQNPVPQPVETIVTRWSKDRFACGSYSYVSATSQPDDYEAMAKPTGNLYFAGEATCGTHPATVHGAYISGLRAASEVINDLLGPINIPSPLVPAASDKEYSHIKQKPDFSTGNVSSALNEARLEAFETEILKSIFASLGPRPGKPSKAGSNPFLLFTKDKWAECKIKCDEARRAAVGNPNTKASRNEVRIALGQLWREASHEVKQPYIEKTLNNRVVNHESAATFQDRLAGWDAEAMGIRRTYVRDHPGVLSREEEKQMWQALGAYGGGERRAKKMSGYADNSESEVDI